MRICPIFIIVRNFQPTCNSLNNDFFIGVPFFEDSLVDPSESAFIDEDLESDVGPGRLQQTELFRWVCYSVFVGLLRGENKTCTILKTYKIFATPKTKRA